MQFQIELSEHFQDRKKAVMEELIRMSKFSTKVHKQNTVLEQQRLKSSSSSSSTGSGCCMGFLQCLGIAPAAAPAAAVVPGSSTTLEIEAAPTTAFPMPPSGLLSEEQQQLAELLRKMQQLEATLTGGSSGSGGHWPARHWRPKEEQLQFLEQTSSTEHLFQQLRFL